MRFRILSVLLAIAAGLSTQASLSDRLVTAQAPNIMAIDANRATPEVDAVSPPVMAGGSAAVSVNIEAAGEPYDTYQWEISWDPAELDYVTGSGTHLTPGGLTACFAFTQGTFTEGSLVGHNYVNTACGVQDGPGATTTFTGQVDLLDFRCVSVGTHTLHLVTTAEDDASGSTIIKMSTELVDAQVTCQEAVGPAPTATPSGGPTPTGTTATPTPLPPGFEAVTLVGGCQFEAWTGADGTTPDQLAALVDPVGNLVSLWAQQPAPMWRGYSPQFPEVSDLGPANLLDVVAICTTGPAVFVRPVV